MLDGAKQGNRSFYNSVLATIPWGRMDTPAEVADGVVFLASSRAGWITGACLGVDGGQHKANPLTRVPPSGWRMPPARRLTRAWC